MDLKPCPFCGATMRIDVDNKQHIYRLFGDHTDDCFFDASESTGPDLQWNPPLPLNEIIEALFGSWNERATTTVSIIPTQPNEHEIVPLLKAISAK